jgi:SAM-dependent methyltransferase
MSTATSGAQRARELAREALADGRPTEWFDRLYVEANDDPAEIPWAYLRTHPGFERWLGANPLDGIGRRALVIGCGLGDDAEELASRGFDVTAFDISPNAIAWCRRRFPESKVDYRAANLFEAPADWAGRFDFLLEIYTVQALPPTRQAEALRALAPLVAPGGELLVISRGALPGDVADGPPWPPEPTTFDLLADLGLERVSADIQADPSQPRVLRLTLHYRRPR